MTDKIDTIAPGVNYSFAVGVSDRSDPTLPSVPAAGLGNVTAYLSDTETGSAIAGLGPLPCTESGTMTLDDGTTGSKYRGEFLAASTLVPLSTRVGRSVWLRPFVGDEPLKAKQLFVEAAP